MVMAGHEAHVDVIRQTPPAAILRALQLKRNVFGTEESNGYVGRCQLIRTREFDVMMEEVLQVLQDARDELDWRMIVEDSQVLCVVP